MTAIQAGILALIAAQVGLAVWTLRDLRRHGLGFFSTFNAVVCVALALPFCLIAAHAGGLVEIPVHIGGTPESPVALPFGDGLRPLLLLTAWQACSLLGAHLAGRRRPDAASEPLRMTEPWPLLAGAGTVLGAIAVGYILVRAVLVPDFPLWVILRGEVDGRPLRDVAFAYGSNRQAPWLFLPSIHSQFYRIILPLSALLVLTAWWRLRRPWMLWTGSALALAAIAMAVGTCKRTPIVYLAMWGALLWAMFRPLAGRWTLRLGLIGAAGIVAALAMTSLYTSKALTYLGHRIVFGESVGDYLALEHHPRTFPYRGFSVLGAYASKAAGGGGESFSQTWKQAVTGGRGRGFEAVGLFTEIHVGFGPVLCLVAALLWGFLLRATDLGWAARLAGSGARPMLAGMMTIVAAMSVKGGIAQVFTGGLATLALVLAAWLALRRRR